MFDLHIHHVKCICQLITDIVDQPCLIYTFIMLVYLSANHWHCWSTMFDLHIHHVCVLVRLSLTLLINHVWSTHSSCWCTCQIITDILDQPCLIYTFIMLVYLSADHWHCWSTMFDLHIHHVCVLVSLSLTFLINHVWFTHSSCLCTCQLITDIVDQPCLIYTFIMFVYLSAHHWHCWSTMFDLHLHHVMSLSAYHWHCWSTMFDLLIYTFIMFVYLSISNVTLYLSRHLYSV